MWWAIAAAGLLAVISVPVWGWRPLARAWGDTSGGAWLPVARSRYAAQAARGRWRRLTATTGVIAAAAALSLVGTFLWRVSVDDSLTVTELPQDLAAQGVPSWITIAVVALGAASVVIMRVGLIGQAAVARRELNAGHGSVVAMALSAWVWARMIAPAVRAQRDEAERARIAALGPEPAPTSRFALPIEAAADEPVPPAPGVVPTGNTAGAVPGEGAAPAEHAPQGGADQTPPPSAHEPPTMLSALPPSAHTESSNTTGEQTGGDTTGTTPQVVGQAPAAMATGWALVTQDGARLELTRTRLTVGRAGRGATADVTITDPTRTMSKAHAELRWDGAQWWVRDLGSTNGTHMERDNGSVAPLPRDEPVPVSAAMRFGELAASIVNDAERSDA